MQFLFHFFLYFVSKFVYIFSFNRYGGISYADNIINNNQSLEQPKAIIWFENQALHSMTSFLHEFYSTYSQCVANSINNNGTGSSSSLSCSLVDNPRKPLYRIYNHPISLNDQRISYDSILQKVNFISYLLNFFSSYGKIL